MDRTVTSPHEILNPDTLAAPVGFSHAVVPAKGKTVYLGGQAAHDVAGKIVGTSVAEQFSQAARNVMLALGAAGGSAEHLVSMHIYVTDVDAYRNSLEDLANVYREHFGRHYPAIALFEVKGLFDPDAKVELVCVAVVPSEDV